MIDSLYLLGAIVFFALMLGYVSGCAWLGRRWAGQADVGKERAP